MLVRFVASSFLHFLPFFNSLRFIRRLFRLSSLLALFSAHSFTFVYPSSTFRFFSAVHVASFAFLPLSVLSHISLFLVSFLWWSSPPLLLSSSFRAYHFSSSLLSVPSIVTLPVYSLLSPRSFPPLRNIPVGPSIYFLPDATHVFRFFAVAFVHSRERTSSFHRAERSCIRCTEYNH